MSILKDGLLFDIIEVDDKQKVTIHDAGIFSDSLTEILTMEVNDFQEVLVQLKAKREYLDSKKE